MNYIPEYNLLKDAYLGAANVFNNKLDYLARIAPEKWTFKINTNEYPKIGDNLPILYNYLNFTYDRLKQENKICFSNDSKYMCFNTGLQTSIYGEDVF